MEEATENKLKTIIIPAVAVLLMAAVIGYWYWSQKRVQEPVSTLGSAKEVSESVPEIQTNPGQKIPEINPLDRANPFKYSNPLR